jgi:glutathione S-transferase
VPEWGEANKSHLADFLSILDRALAGQPFIAGTHYSVADITALVAVDFMKPAKLAVAPEQVNIRRWHAHVSSRPSAVARILTRFVGARPCSFAIAVSKLRLGSAARRPNCAGTRFE